jgi:hypothetical protein
MQFIISPKVERTVTITMTETEARDLSNRFHSYRSLIFQGTHYNGERVMHQIVTGLTQTLAEK